MKGPKFCFILNANGLRISAEADLFLMIALRDLGFFLGLAVTYSPTS